MLSAHEAPVLYAEFDPSGRRVVTASADFTARIWDSETGKGLALLKGHVGKVYRARFSADGFRIVTASEDHTAGIWEAATMDQLSIELKGHEGDVTGIRFSPDSQTVVTWSRDKSSRIWSVGSGMLTQTLMSYPEISDKSLRADFINEIREAVFTPDGKQVLIASIDIKGSVMSTGLTGTGKKIVQEYKFRPTRLWDTQNGKHLKAYPLKTGGAYSADVSADGRFAVITSSGKIRESVKLTGFFRRGWHGGSKDYSDQNTAIVVELSSGKEMHTLGGHHGTVYDACFSPDGLLIITADWQGVYIWDALTGLEIRKLEDCHGARQLEFTPDGKQIMAVFGDVGFWSVETGRLLFRLKPEGAKSNLTFARLSPDASHVLCLDSFGKVLMFDAETGGKFVNLDHHTRKVTHGSFSPDGSLVLLGSEDRTASVWKVSDGSLIQVLTGHKGEINQTAFSPDGNWMATVSDDYTTRLWPVKALKR